MSGPGERPVPVGNLNNYPSDRNEYLETGVLNESDNRGGANGGNVVGSSSSSRNPPAPHHTSSRDRDLRHSTPASVYGGSSYGGKNTSFHTGGGGESNGGGGGGAEYEGMMMSREPMRARSRTEYYGERDYYGHERDPYYSIGRYPPAPPPHHIPGPPSSAYYPPPHHYHPMHRSYGGTDYYGDPNHSFYNSTPAHMMPYSQPPGGVPKPSKKEVKAHLEMLRVQEPEMYRTWYKAYKSHLEAPSRIPMPPIPGLSPHHPPPPPPPSQQQLLSSSSYQVPYGSGPYTPRGTARERPDVHSGRSSVNEAESSIYNPYDDTGSIAPNDTMSERSPSRSTPLKFLTGHALSIISPNGNLFFLDSGSFRFKVAPLRSLFGHLDEVEEMESFPGPLLRGKTHKNTVIKFCERKIRAIESEGGGDSDNLILLWELLILLIRQNGSVVGSDIADLLLSKKKKVEEIGHGVSSGGGGGESSEQSSCIDENDEDVDSGLSSVFNPTITPISSKESSEAQITESFTNLLLFGHKNDALELAMSKGLWGHALFLASKMGDKEYGQVMSRFANGVSPTHPLQTLYQILSGKVPSVAKSCMDEAFGDWKPHLAMIISNSGLKPELVQKTYTTMGDTLNSKNMLYGAQFCYLMAHSSFSDSSQLGPLLGLNPSKSNLLEATQMTEIYEYANSLSEPSFCLGPSFLWKKFTYAVELLNYGLTSQGLSYCEVLSKQLENIEEDDLKRVILSISERLFGSEGEAEWVEVLRRGLSYASEDNLELNQNLDANITEINHDYENNQETQNNQTFNQYQTEQNMESNEAQNQVINPNYNSTMRSNSVQFLDVGAQGSQGYGNSYLNETQTGSTYENGPNSLPQQDNYDPNSNNSIYTQNWAQSQSQIGSSTGGQVPMVEIGTSTLGPGPFLNTQPQSHQFDMGMGGGMSNSQPLQQSYIAQNNINPIGEVKSYERDSYNPQQQQQQSYYSHMQTQQQSSSQPLPFNEQQSMQDKRKKVHFEEEVDEDGSWTEDEYEEEQEEEEKVVPSFQPVEFKSTYPIDTPLSSKKLTKALPLPPSALVTRKSNTLPRTYPIDRQCCKNRSPCSEHSLKSSGSSTSLYEHSHSQPLMYSSPPQKNEESGLRLRAKQGAQQKQGESPNKSSDESKKEGKNKAKKESGGNKKSSSWIPGWLRPKNQMILPDDSDPSIVWDEKTKSWVNTKEEDDEDARPKGPPPKDSDLMRQSAPPPQQQFNNSYGAPPPPSQAQNNYSNPPNYNTNNSGSNFGNQAPLPNNVYTGSANFNNNNNNMGGNSTDGPKFKPQLNTPFSQPQNWSGSNSGGPESMPLSNSLQPPSMNKYQLPKGKGMRGKYVDILSPGGTVKNGAGPPPQPMSFEPPMSNGPMMFVPQPIESDETVLRH